MAESGALPWPSERLPQLRAYEQAMLDEGLPVMRQEREGREGSGFVVMDVNAPPSVVVQCLQSFEDYDTTIPVIRKAEVCARGTAQDGRSLTYVDYRISKFWLAISAVHRADEREGVVRFDLAPGCSGLVLKEASGFWRVQPTKQGCRVWLCVRLRAAGGQHHGCDLTRRTCGPDSR